MAADDAVHQGQADAGAGKIPIQMERWKVPKSLSEKAISKPAPLSRTK